jgi:hypothetical protein
MMCCGALLLTCRACVRTAEGVLDTVSWRRAIEFLLSSSRAGPASLDGNEAKGLSVHLQRLFALCDIEAHGIIGVSEFACSLAALTAGSVSQKLTAAFRLYDADSDEKVTKTELYKLTRSLFRGVAACALLKQANESNMFWCNLPPSSLPLLLLQVITPAHDFRML